MNIKYLIILLLFIGVGVMLEKSSKYLYKRLSVEKHRKDLEENLNQNLQEISNKLNDTMRRYDNLSNALSEYKRNINSYIINNEKQVQNIIDISNKLIDHSNLFYEKVQLISKTLSNNELSSDESQKLINIITKDTEEQQKLTEIFRTSMERARQNLLNDTPRNNRHL